jgi:hypothetical protein
MILMEFFWVAKTISGQPVFFPLPDCALQPKFHFDASLTHLPFLGVSSLMNWPCACKRRAAFFFASHAPDIKTGDFHARPRRARHI